MARRYSLAKRKAAELLQKGDVRKPPVPLAKLARCLNAVVRHEPFEGELSGMVHRKRGSSFVIGVNSSHSKGRRRFTTAHELGHLILHKDEDLHIDERFPIGFRTPASSTAEDDREIEANCFAAELLMPVEFLINEIESLPDDTDLDSAISELVKRFDVSTQAMTVRLSALGVLK